MLGTNRAGWMSWATTAGVGFVAGMVALTVFVFTRYGSVAAAAHALQGDVVLCDRYEAEVEAQPSGQVIMFRLTNRSSRPIRLIGSQSSCSCVMATGLPRGLDPGATTTLEIRYQPKKQAVARREVIRVFTDQATQGTLSLAISARPTREAEG